ncbi:MAG: ribosome small subunit-dependent GTPase A [Gemmatimonadetes bacterium]|nr:ribosome small subunit-dependent GTPase A [Gemmatimonadota bacterium]
MSVVEAVVLQGTGGIYQLRTVAGEMLEASIRGRLKQEGQTKIAVGDNVGIDRDERDGAWAIIEIRARRSTLSRKTPGRARGERIVAANVDQVVVVFAAAKPEPHVRMIDRFLVIAEGNDIAACLVINKTDLVGGPAGAAVLAQEYERAGYPVFRTSVQDQTGLRELHDTLAGRTSALTGPSGVGKSSLLNALFPGLDLRTGEISESVNKGRHTTVGARLIPVPDALGGYVVDTPGLREVGMWGLSPEHLDQCFPEFKALIGECKFADCGHDHEPGCAIRLRVEAGTISRARWESYLKLRSELRDLERAW